MSISLTAFDKSTGREVYLFKTPTWVTEMCLISWKTKRGKHRLRHWKDTRKIYLDWADSRTEQVFHSTEEYKKEFIDTHKANIMSFDELVWGYQLLRRDA